MAKSKPTEWSFESKWIMGAVRTTRRQKFVDPRYRKYERWKNFIRLAANVAGVPQVLDKRNRYGIAIVIDWRGAARCDLDNCVKGVLDALFSQDRSVQDIKAASIEKTGCDSMSVVFWRL
jgi:Holliday junction resolvase RusA-like endonuclease